MMNETIQNNRLCVRISRLGGEIQSIRDSEGTEYIWQGDPAYWSGRAINLFPYVGRLTEQSYTVDGRTYQMDIHGFLKDSEMTVASKTEDNIVFELRDGAETRRTYPFPFVLRIEYALRGLALDIVFRVQNSGRDTMYFGLGGHPGFCVPLEPGLDFTDYYLEFGNPCRPIRVGMSDDCFVTDDDSVMELEEGRRLPLRHDLFDDDAIILKNVDRKVFLKSRGGRKAVAVSFPDMPFLGLWHRPKTDAPYVCIEPWTSLPSRKGIIEDIGIKSDMAALPPGGEYANAWRIEVL